MAFARDSYTATGGQTDFTISFPYLAAADVNVYVNGTALDQDSDADTGSFQIISSTTARIGAGLTVDDAVVIVRTTSQNARLVDYASGSTLTEEDLDDDSLQAFYMAQEAIDQAGTAMGLGSDDQFDATSLRITNVATPTASTDAATKGYVDAASIAAGNVPTPDNPGDDNYVLVANGGTFDWAAFDASTDLTITGQTAGDVLYYNGSAWTRLAVGSSGQLITSSGTAPQWSNPASQVVGARAYIDGLITSNDVDADHDILFGVGEATDSSNTIIGTNDAAIAKQIDATWASGDDAGGLASGVSLTADTWYALHALFNSSGDLEFGFDTSATATNLLADAAVSAAGYDQYYRRIGWVLTDATSNILAYHQRGDDFILELPINDRNGVSMAAGATATITVSVPVNCKGEFAVAMHDSVTETATAYIWIYETSRADDVPSTSAGFSSYNSSNVSNTAAARAYGGGKDKVWVDGSNQIKVSYTGTSSGSTFVNTIGWMDPRGRTVT